MLLSPLEDLSDQRWGVAPRVYVGEDDPRQGGQRKWLDFVIPPGVGRRQHGPKRHRGSLRTHSNQYTRVRCVCAD